eukprot:CAMPEP_0118936046 /NCGR_PEP_ID=MMETSP1169-20130426/15976_1 /TAXON_ID=36882 /ORGANISM="Pyramimonas obovata, Strain CCMP722" /LENGTH=260 /DNA_ID=CAMNT_0006879145 /DNA_START=370 /DNA_END=1149 /DNA_ORIENTATION=-
MEKKDPMKIFLVAGTQSGVGKTSIAIGLMAAFRRRGLKVQPFKVGPDFIDPLHHRMACGRPSFNLDGWMLDSESTVANVKRRAKDCDVAVVEGVMGLFDGLDGSSDTGSTAQMAKWLSAPVVLVLDCWAMGRSVAALIKGFELFDPDLNLAGIILNKVGSPAHAEWLIASLKAAKCKVPVIGSVPQNLGVAVPEDHHLGVTVPGPDDAQDEYIKRLAEIMESSIDLDALLEKVDGSSFSQLATPGGRGLVRHASLDLASD